MNSFFRRAFTFFHSNKKRSIALLLVVFAALLFISSQLSFEEDITKLIPSNEKTENTQKILKNVNFSDKIIVNIKRAPNTSVNELTEYASQFIDSLNKNSEKYIKHIQGQVAEGDINNTLDFVYNNLPLFLDKEDYKKIEKKIVPDSIKNITNNNYKTLLSPTGFIAKDFILKDPLGLSWIALKKLQQLSFGDDFTLHNGFLLTQNKENLLLFITPQIASSETDENTKFVTSLYNINSQLNQKFTNKVHAEYYGGALIAVANANQIKKDIHVTISIAMSVLFIILILFYKKLSLPLILFTPTLFGGLLATSILFIIRGQISAISLGIGSILLGVTLDYSLHILTHIRSNNNINNLYNEITKPTLMSSLTTALAFLCLLFLDSQALQDLGIFAAVSVLGASFFGLIFIPQVYKTTVNTEKQNNLFEKVASYKLHKNKLSIIAVSLLIIGSLFTYSKVTFNKDLSKLNYQTPELLDAEKRLNELTNIASKSIYLATYDTSEQKVLQVNDIILKKLAQLKQNGDLIDYSSIGSLVYSEKKQKSKITEWEQFWNTQKTEDLKNHLITSGQDLGFKPDAHKLFYNQIERKFTPIKSEEYKALKAIYLDDYITDKNNGIVTVTSLLKTDNENVEKIISAFKDFPNTIVIDRKQMNETFLGNLKDDFNNLIGYSFIVVLLILLIAYRSFSLTLITLIPVCLTWLITIGVMGLLKIEFNIFNIIISTFIFGLGIDYSIFITNGLLHEYTTGEKALTTHKTSIILSVITTILGVGVLIFAKHPALYTISIVSIIGIFSALVISFTFQPILFLLFIGSTKKRPISIGLLIHSVLSFGYFSIGGILLSLLCPPLLKIIPLKRKTKMIGFRKIMSSLMKSVLYTNPFFKKTVINNTNETFTKQGIIIANHTSFLDILAVGMLHPKIIFLVTDWVYNSPIFGRAVKLAGFYPVSRGIENGVLHLKEKVDQGYSLMVFPEGTRSKTNKIRRFHKGAFLLAEQLKLDIIPILIHGNSEVLPKNSFIIKNGSLTLKILERIPYNSNKWGVTYSEKTKKIGNHFRTAFRSLSQQIEHKAYYHPIILEEYRYKGDRIFKEVTADLKENSDNYFKIINSIPPMSSITHVTDDFGQLDFLLSLDSFDRKINILFSNQKAHKLVKNSFITHNRSKINCIKNKSELTNLNSEVLIISSLKEDLVASLSKTNYRILIFLKNGLNLNIQNNLGFTKTYSSKNLVIYIKEDSTHEGFV